MKIDMKNWNASPVTGVVLCGGAGTRLWPLTEQRQKAMIEVGGKPLIDHILAYWAPVCRDFVFVVKHAKSELIHHIETTNLPSRFVEPKELRGIADGLSYARPHIHDRFVVILGDCLCRGTFQIPDGMVQGITYRKASHPDEIRRSFSIELNENTGCATHVVEKPKLLPNDFCGMGFYFFDSRVFEYISRTPASPLRNEVEITDVIENMISSGEQIHAVPFVGEYLNVTSAEDIPLAEHLVDLPSHS